MHYQKLPCGNVTLVHATSSAALAFSSYYFSVSQWEADGIELGEGAGVGINVSTA